MILTFNSYREASYIPNATEIILTLRVYHPPSVGAAETGVSMEDATDEKSQRQPRKRKRNSSGSEDREKAQDTEKETQGRYVRTFSFVLLFRCTDFYRTMLRRVMPPSVCL